MVQCLLLYLHVCTCMCCMRWFLFCLVLQMWSILLVLIIISVFSTSIKLRMMETALGFVQIHSFCLALGIVELNVICLAFYVEGNISSLVTVNLTVEVWGGKYLSSQLLLRVIWKALISLVQFTLILYNNEEVIVRGCAFQCLQACDNYGYLKLS